jgi:MFS family permease
MSATPEDLRSPAVAQSIAADVTGHGQVRKRSISNSLEFDKSLDDLAAMRTPTLVSPSSYDRRNPSASDVRNLSCLFWSLFFLQITVNFDNGCVPAVLADITKEFQFTPIFQGYLLSFQYVGLTAMSPISGIILQSRLKKNVVLGTCIVVNSCAVLMLAFAPASAPWLALASRILIGLSQSTFVIYAPVWVDEYAPNNKQALWLSLCQAGIPLGIMVGYATAGSMKAANAGWRVPLIIQGCVLALFGSTLFFVPNRFLDVSHENAESSKRAQSSSSGSSSSSSSHGGNRVRNRSRGSTGSGGSFENFKPSKQSALRRDAERFGDDNSNELDQNDPNDSLLSNRDEPSDSLSSANSSSSAKGRPATRSRADSLAGDGSRIDSVVQFRNHTSLNVCKQLRLLASSSLFVYMTLALSSLFFVVTGIQQWITVYLTDAVGAKYGDVVLLFTICSATGPTLGVFFGGWFCDKIGGYRGVEGLARSSKLVCCFAILAVGSAFPAGFTSDLNSIMFLIWLLLFWGGAIMPIATGLILSSVHISLRSFSSAVSMCTYNLLGYSLGGFLPGMLRQIVEDNFQISRARSLAWGVRLILFWSLFGLLFGGLAAITSHRKLQKSLAAPSPRRQKRRAKKRKVERDLAHIVAETGGDFAEERHLDFDMDLDESLGRGGYQHGPDADDEGISDGASEYSVANDDSSDEEFYDGSVTADDIQYEFSRQPYVPVFTGGANVINELATSLSDYGSGMEHYINRERSVQSGNGRTVQRYSFDDLSDA